MATTIATATFPGASGAAWPTTWTITGSTATQLGSGAARLSPPAAAYNNGAIRALFNGTGGMPATSDQEVRGTFRLPVTGEQYHDIGLGATTATQVTNGTIVPTTGFFVSIYPTGVSLFRAYDLHEDAVTTTIAINTAYSWAFRRVASDKVAWKHWTGTEPSTWTVTATVSGSTDTTAGYVFLSAGNGSGTTVRPFDQMGPITITDGATGTAYTATAATGLGVGAGASGAVSSTVTASTSVGISGTATAQIAAIATASTGLGIGNSASGAIASTASIATGVNLSSIATGTDSITEVALTSVALGTTATSTVDAHDAAAASITLATNAAAGVQTAVTASSSITLTTAAIAAVASIDVAASGVTLSAGASSVIAAADTAATTLLLSTTATADSSSIVATASTTIGLDTTAARAVTTVIRADTGIDVETAASSTVAMFANAGTTATIAVSAAAQLLISSTAMTILMITTSAHDSDGVAHTYTASLEPGWRASLAGSTRTTALASNGWEASIHA